MEHRPDGSVGVCDSCGAEGPKPWLGLCAIEAWEWRSVRGWEGRANDDAEEDDWAQHIGFRRLSEYLRMAGMSLDPCLDESLEAAADCAPIVALPEAAWRGFEDDFQRLKTVLWQELDSRGPSKTQQAWEKYVEARRDP